MESAGSVGSSSLREPLALSSPPHLRSRSLSPQNREPCALRAPSPTDVAQKHADYGGGQAFGTQPRPYTDARRQPPPSLMFPTWNRWHRGCDPPPDADYLTLPPYLPALDRASVPDDCFRNGVFVGLTEFASNTNSTFDFVIEADLGNDIIGESNESQSASKCCRVEGAH